jgi:hypothetical protein
MPVPFAMSFWQHDDNKTTHNHQALDENAPLVVLLPPLPPALTAPAILTLTTTVKTTAPSPHRNIIIIIVVIYTLSKGGQGTRIHREEFSRRNTTRTLLAEESNIDTVSYLVFKNSRDRDDYWL